MLAVERIIEPISVSSKMQHNNNKDWYQKSLSFLIFKRVPIPGGGGEVERIEKENCA
jgi:hypothetical protein